MSKSIKRRRGTAVEHQTFVGLDGEITVDTTSNSIRVHDNSTAGGFETARADGSNIHADTIDINGGTIDGAVIGADTPAAITGTDLAGTSLDLSSSTVINSVLDEDNFSSNSATALATQQSIKAYVDAQVTAQDLDIVGDTGTDSIDLDSETLTFTGGTGITSVVTAGTVTHNIDSTVTTLTGTQTLTNKTLTSPDINGGTIDGTVIGATTTAAGSFTIVTASGEITANGGIALGDNDKATFGTDDDLQIYHDGSSRIANSTGNLIISDTDGDIYIQAKAGENSIRANNDGSVLLYFDNVEKLSTTATGIDVTGTVTADGLTVDTATGSASPVPSKITIATSTSASDWSTTAPWGRLAFYSADASAGGAKEEVTLDVISAQAAGGVADFTINTYNSGAKERFRISYDGDISFYEDTGTTPKFVWSSSAESLTVPVLITTGNTTLGDASTDTVTVNGYMGVGGAGSAATGLRVNNTALTGANQFGFLSDITATSGATNNISGYYSRINTAADTYTTASVFNVQIRDVVKGAGHTITSQHGVYIADQTQGTNNYGITSLVSSGTNKWNIYASGTAQNYFAGNVGINVAPSNWSVASGGGVLQIGGYGSYAFGAGTGWSSSPHIYIGNNGYANSGWKYASAKQTAQYYQINNTHLFLGSTDASPTVGGAITFAERFRIGDTEAVFNEPGNDYDFRVESDADTHALFVDAGSNRVGIGRGTLSAKLHLQDSVANVPLQILQNSYARAPGIHYGLEFRDNVDEANANIVISQQNAGNNAAQMEFYVNAGTGGNGLRNGVNSLTLYPSVSVFNEGGADQDFRVETDGADYAFFVDGSTNNIGIQSGTEWPIVGGGNGTSGQGSSIDMGYDATIYGGSAYWAGGLDIGTNFWRDASGYHYKKTDRQATAYQQSSQGASHAFFSQTSGNAGDLISWNNLLYMDRSQTIFNDTGADTDFRVESGGNANMLLVDAGNNRVHIGGSNISDGELNVNDMIRISGAAPELRIDVGSAGYYLQLTEEYNFPKSIGHIRSVAGTSYEGQLQFSANADRGTYRELARMDYASGTVFNETSADIDFRVESESNTHALFVDAGANGVNIGGSDTIQGQLNVVKNTGNSTASNTQLYITSGNSYGLSTAKKNLDLLFQGYRDGAGTGNGVKVRMRSVEQTGSSRVGVFYLHTLDDNGNLQEAFNASSSNVIINDESNDQNFRVESSTNANALYVDGATANVGIGTGSPRAALEVSNGKGTHALGGYFFRETTNAVVDILTVSGQPTNSGVAIYARLVAVGAVGNEAAVIEFWAALNRQSGGADTATAVAPVVSKAIVGSAIGAGSLAWSGKTLQYTPACATNYVGYQMEIQVSNQDPATITILP